MKRVAEICCGSYYDAKQAFLGGAKRIELSCGLSVGGLTPTVATLDLIKTDFNLEIAAIVRPRAAGFTYLDEEYKVMLAECEELSKNGADGIVFGCLNSDLEIDRKKCEKLIEISKRYNRDVVFHRAFDCCKDPFKAAEELIEMGVDRILTSGQQEDIIDGVPLLTELQKSFGDKITFIAAGHVTGDNVKQVLDTTKLTQAHSSCKALLSDPSTVGANVSYSVLPYPNEYSFAVASREEVEKFVFNTENL